MIDRDKVIKRLESVSYYFKSLLAVGWQGDADIYREHRETVRMAIALLKEQEPNNSKYEYKHDHTDCLWYGSDNWNQCPSTCSQYRDGWNDAMDYVFKNGKGYKPYVRR